MRKGTCEAYSVAASIACSLAARSAVLGACLNVKINAVGLKDQDKAAELITEAENLAAKAETEEKEILEIVNSKING